MMEELKALSNDDLNRRAAEKVMGWRHSFEGAAWLDKDGNKAAHTQGYTTWDPCKDPRHAAMLREKLAEDKWVWSQDWNVNSKNPHRYNGQFTHFDTMADYGEIEWDTIAEEPRALTIAAIWTRGQV